MESLKVANYFVVFGCHPDSSISPDTLSTKLYSYPDSVQRYEDAAIQLLSMPSGLIITENKCEPITHSFLVTRGNGSKYYGTCSTVYDSAHTANLFVSRSIVLVSDFPFYAAMQRYLEELLKMLSSPRPLITLESYIFNLINTVTFPSTDCILRLTSPTDIQLYVTLPSREDLPVFQLGYLQLCRFLNPSNVVKVVTCILLEHSIIIQSDNLDKLNYFCESLTSLIYPFFWTYPYVPILPSPSLEFLDAPLPFIIGWLSQGENSLASELNFTTAYCRINLSTSTVEFSDHYIPQLPFSGQIHKQLTSLYNLYLFSNSRSLETSENHVSSLTELMSIVEDISNIRVQSESKCKVSNSRKNTPPKEVSNFEVFSKEALSQMELDCKIRNTFYSLFLNAFSDVAKFIVIPNTEGTSLTRTFDKIAFLSEKTTKDREFFSLFFETQMFTTFIDDLIDNISDVTALNNRTHPVAKLFINHLRNRSESTNLSCPVGAFNSTCDRLISRAKNSQYIPDSVAPAPTEISTHPPPPDGYNGIMPDNMYIPMVCPLNNDSHTDSPNTEVCDPLTNGNMETEMVREPGKLDYPHLIAVELSDLLKQARLRIKQLITHHVSLTLRHHYEPDLNCSDTPRILVGHRKYSSISVEDKGLFSKLIEALETIWSHGYKGNAEGSHLWEHILAFKHNQPSSYTDIAALPVVDIKRRFKAKYQKYRSFSYSIHGSLNRDSETRRKSLGASTNPLQSEIQYILDQENIMTDSGRVRMWVKLLLEKQALSLRVKELLTLHSHIAHNYNRSAFLCTDNELEQLVYHIDSLSCVEFSCFTNDFTQSQIEYAITLSLAKSVLKHTSVLWLVVSGTLGRTDVIRLAKGSTFCCFKCRNIGHILGVRIGHDNGGINPDVFVNNIKITNNLTGHLFCIGANRNLSDKQKDESVEHYFSARKFITQSKPKTEFEDAGCGLTLEAMKSHLQDSIRDVIHYFTEPRLAIHSLSYLILGERRFISYLVDMLLFEINCNKNPYTQLWTYFSHILLDMKYSLSQSASNSSSQNKLINTFNKLQNYNNRSGPIEKVYVLLVTALSHQILHEWMEMMSESKFTGLYYRESAFLLNTELRECLYGAVATLRTYRISADPLFTLYID